MESTRHLCLAPSRLISMSRDKPNVHVGSCRWGLLVVTAPRGSTWCWDEARESDPWITRKPGNRGFHSWWMCESVLEGDGKYGLFLEHVDYSRKGTDSQTITQRFGRSCRALWLQVWSALATNNGIESPMTINHPWIGHRRCFLCGYLLIADHALRTVPPIKYKCALLHLAFQHYHDTFPATSQGPVPVQWMCATADVTATWMCTPTS